MCITTGCYNLKIAFILLKMLFQFNYSRFIEKPPFIVFRKHETPAVIGRGLAPSTMVMPDFSKNRLIGGQPRFKKQDNLWIDVDFFTLA